MPPGNPGLVTAAVPAIRRDVPMYVPNCGATISRLCCAIWLTRIITVWMSRRRDVGWVSRRRNPPSFLREKWWVTLRYPPYEAASLLRVRLQQPTLRQNSPTGKSLRIIRSRVKPKNRKESQINRWPRRANQMHNSARLPR